MPRAGPKRVQQYSTEFKVAAVRLSQQVQAVAAALDVAGISMGGVISVGLLATCRQVPSSRLKNPTMVRHAESAAARLSRVRRKPWPVPG